MEDLKDVHYDAFISYKHCELDGFVAKTLHRKLEAFKLPKSVCAKVRNGKTRIERVFRDEEELSLSENLADPINNALKNSDYLIAICSPRYPKSEWCIKEIEVFLQTHDHEHILVVLAEDEPCNSFPEILTYEEYTATDENGESITKRRELEPLAADTRGADKKEIKQAIDTAVIKLCSVMFGLNYDDLKQRHREQKLKRMLAVFGIIGAALLAFAVFATSMLVKISRQNVTIKEQYAALQDTYAGTIAEASLRLLGEGRRKDAVYAARSVLPDTEDQPHNCDVVNSLYTALNVYGHSDKYVPVCTYDMDSEIVGFEVSYDNSLLLLNDVRSICVFDRETGEKLEEAVGGEDSGGMLGGSFCGADGFIACSEEGTEYISLTGKGRKKLPDVDPYSEFFSSADGRITLAYCDDILKGIDADGNILYTMDMGDEFDSHFLEAGDVSFGNGVFSICLLDGTGYYILVADEETGRKRAGFEADGTVWIRSAMDGNMLYYTICDYTSFGTELWSTLYAYDWTAGKEIWKKDLPDLNCKDICLAGDFLYVYDEYSIVVLENKKGTVYDLYSSEIPIISGWYEDGYFYYAKYNGTVFMCNEEMNFGVNSTYLKDLEANLIEEATIDGDRYIWIDRASYISRYSVEINPDVLHEDERSERPDTDPFEAVELMSSAAGMEPDRAFYSDDGKYIFARFPYLSSGIYDPGTLERVASLDISESLLLRFEYSDLTGCYILSSKYRSYLLDDEFKVFCVTDSIQGCEGNRLIMRDASGNFYSVPYVSYEELIRRTDEYLDGYVPSDKVLQKYSLMRSSDDMASGAL